MTCKEIKKIKRETLKGEKEQEVLLFMCLVRCLQGFIADNLSIRIFFLTVSFSTLHFFHRVKTWTDPP